MITVIKQGNAYNRRVISLEGLSTDTKPVEYFIETDSNGVEVARVYIENGSTFTEIDTGKLFMYDAENNTWYEIETSGGGGGGTQGGIVLVGETTTALTDEATTNPITVDGQPYTAQPNDAVIYGSKEFLFDGTKWHEFGDLSGLTSKDIGAMTGYAKASTGSAIAPTDTLNQAIGKVEKRTEVNENNISYLANNSVKNIFHRDAGIYNHSNIKFTTNADGSISLSGTAHGDAVLPLSDTLDTTDDTYILYGDGFISGVFMDTYETGYTNRRTFTSSVVTNSNTKIWRLIVNSGTNVNGVTIRPMLCKKSLFDADSTYVPYAPTNRELYEMILALQSGT